MAASFRSTAGVVRRSGLFSTLFIFLAAATVPAGAVAASADIPAAAREVRTVVVLGDSMGDGVWAGLSHHFRGDRGYKIIRKSRAATGLVRKDHYDWNSAARTLAASMKIDIAVVVIGTNDSQSIAEGKTLHPPFRPRWIELYRQRVDELSATLRQAGARVYWVGLPTMRNRGFSARVARLNAIFAEQASQNAVSFISAAGMTAGADREFYREEVTVRNATRRIRAEDGIHFTMYGYTLLSKPVYLGIRRDCDGIILADRGR